MYDRNALIALVREKALSFGQFTLASGKTASYYLDCRKLTLDSAGAVQVAEGVLERLGEPLPDAVGGMAIGADPITAAVITLAHLRGKKLKGFIVRKEAKGHGQKRDVEGPVAPGESAVIVEDVLTTGGSALAAIERAEAFGLRIVKVIGIVDRLEGATEAFAQRGYAVESLLTVRDLGIERE
jgi:orotate phosphoribosyltransferase